jgi:hypothetical protein
MAPNNDQNFFENTIPSRKIAGSTWLKPYIFIV